MKEREKERKKERKKQRKKQKKKEKKRKKQKRKNDGKGGGNEEGRLIDVSHIAQSISGRFSNGDLNGKYHSKTNVVFRILNFHRQPFNFLTRKFPIKRELFFSLDIYKHQ